MEFLTAPRMGRGDFFFGILAATVLWNVGLFLIYGKISLNFSLGLKTDLDLIGSWPLLVTALSIVCDALLIWFVIRRLRDAGYPGWYALGFLIFPILSALVGSSIGLVLTLIGLIALFFIPGEIGPNRFGPDPRGWKSKSQYDEQQERLKSGDI